MPLYVHECAPKLRAPLEYQKMREGAPNRVHRWSTVVWCSFFLLAAGEPTRRWPSDDESAPSKRITTTQSVQCKSSLTTTRLQRQQCSGKVRPSSSSPMTVERPIRSKKLLEPQNIGCTVAADCPMGSAVAVFFESGSNGSGVSFFFTGERCCRSEVGVPTIKSQIPQI
ncbi:hypothetical protein ACLOJK_014228 [Asimina triloba]